MKICPQFYYPNTRANEQTHAQMRMCRTHRFLAVHLIFEVTPFPSFITVTPSVIPVTHNLRHYTQFSKEVPRVPSDKLLQNTPLNNKALSLLEASKLHSLLKFPPCFRSVAHSVPVLSIPCFVSESSHVYYSASEISSY